MEQNTSTYYVDLIVPGEMIFKTLEVTEGELEDVDVLIGMDVISQGDFCISNGNNETVVAFRSSCSLFFEYRQTFNPENKQMGSLRHRAWTHSCLLGEKATWR